MNFYRHLAVFFLIIMVTSARAQNSDAKLANEYYQQGEYDKALALYQDLDNNKSAIPLIHSNYLRLLIDEKKYSEAEKYLDRALKYYPSNLQYQVDMAFLYQVSGAKEKKEKYIQELLAAHASNQYQIAMLAQSLVTHQLFKEAIDFYKQARKIYGSKSAYALDLAAVYRLQNDLENMTEEYINYAEGNPANMSYVKNLFQNILTEKADQDKLEQNLIKKIQKSPDNFLYADLLIWLELQRKNFYAAFIQARAIDKRVNSPGDQCMEIARIAYDNEAWEDAIDIYQYVIDAYGMNQNYAQARRYLIRSRENLIKNEFPVDMKAIIQLVSDYQKLFQEVGPNATTLDALRNQAMLHAFYLEQLDTAISLLEYVIDNQRSPATLVAESKLDLGDIYLLAGQPWESTLLYSQVEKAHKDSPLAYQAKLKNARLNYYTGNFALAKSHLDILKDATTRDISNDAIALSLLITDNTVFDTTDQVMKEFAQVELLIYQHKIAAARQQMEALLAANPGHSITDEVYWLQAKLDLEEGDYTGAIDKLNQITDQFGYDILSDDAAYQKGIILQDYIGDQQAAMEAFTTFLKNHPGSLFAAEARKRIRKMRGDYVN